MKLELPDNNASVLFHMGNALQSIARDIDTSLPVNGHKVTHTETVGDVSRSVTVEPLTPPTNVEEQYGTSVLDDCLDSIDELAESIGIVRQQASDATVEVSDTIDADGLPWDQRINSKGRTRIKGDVWRARQKPNDKTDEEWAEYVESVKTELRALMAIPVTVTYDPNEADPFAIEPPVEVDNINLADAFDEFLDEITPPVEAAVVTPPVVDAVVTPPVVDAVVTPPVVDAVVTPPAEAAVVTPPVVDAVVTPPVVDAVVTPPVVDAVVTPPVTTGPTTFPELMKFITVNNKKLTKESVDEALKAQGLASIALLAARTDLIPQVHAALVKLL